MDGIEVCRLIRLSLIHILRYACSQSGKKKWQCLFQTVFHCIYNPVSYTHLDVYKRQALQLNIKRVRVAQEGEFDPTEYLPISDKDIPQMYAELLDLSLIHI